MSRDVVNAIRNGDTALAAQLHTVKAMLAAAQELARDTEEERAYLAAETAAQQSIIWKLNHENDALRARLAYLESVKRGPRYNGQPALTLTDRGDDGGYCAYGGDE